MSYYILHLTTPDISLYTLEGFLFCRYKDKTENKIPLDDLRAIIVATHQVSFTNSCLAKLLEKNVVILHCNNSYKPVGWSTGFDKVIRTKAFYNQIAQNKEFENNLWKKILKQKVLNQANNLSLLGNDNANIIKLVEKPLISEANIAKKYWEVFFSTLETPQKREHKDAKTFENICLNYGYAVIQTLLYRSVLIHGLLPNLGIHHEEKYNSTPLIYDLMEPFRPFVDFYLFKFKQDDYVNFKNKKLISWNIYCSFCLKNYRLYAKGLSYKLIDYIDIYVEEIVNAYIKFDAKNILLPDITEQYLHMDKHRNREYEE